MSNFAVYFVALACGFILGMFMSGVLYQREPPVPNPYSPLGELHLHMLTRLHNGTKSVHGIPWQCSCCGVEGEIDPSGISEGDCGASVTLARIYGELDLQHHVLSPNCSGHVIKVTMLGILRRCR